MKPASNLTSSTSNQVPTPTEASMSTSKAEVSTQATTSPSISTPKKSQCRKRKVDNRNRKRLSDANKDFFSIHEFNDTPTTSTSSISSSPLSSSSSTSSTTTTSRLPLQSSSTLDQNMLLKKLKNDRHRVYSSRCAFIGCTNNNCTPNVKMVRVPPPQTKPLPNPETADIRSIETYYKKKHFHSLFMEAIGKEEKKYTKELRICNTHGTKKVRHSETYLRRGKEIQIDFNFELPCNDVNACSQDTDCERSTKRYWDERKRHLLTLPGHCEAAVERIIELEQLIQAIAKEQGRPNPLKTSIQTYLETGSSPDGKKSKQTRKYKAEIDTSKKKLRK